MSAPFVPLHVHSHYSLLKALPKIPELVARAKREGCEALALTDRDNLYGAIEFYRECKKAGIKPIIGLDANLGGQRLLLYAKNKEGYRNLLALVTKSHLESPGNPIVTSAMLEEHGNNLIRLDQRDDSVALPEVYYLDSEDRRAWETLRAIEQGGTDTVAMDAEDNEYAFPSAAQMEVRYNRAALAKTHDIAAQCDLTLELGSWLPPEFPLPKGTTPEKELRRFIEKGFARRTIRDTPEVRQRLEYEYKTICEKGFATYFLIVGDLMRYAHEHGILTTIRGSVAGSLVTYLVGITNINPLEYKIPFERFLNPERPKAPDMDMDFADNRRDEVIEYARKKYGADRVAQIGTFGTMLARGVVRDVARALGYPYGLGDRIAREIPFGSQGFSMTLERALRENAVLKKMYESEPETRDIIDLGRAIEGCVRHISVHAAGVVIAPGPLIEYTPLQYDPKGGKIITQYDMYSITDEYGGVGLLKFDFLGLRNLAILADSVRLVKKTRGMTIDIENIPVDDAKTFAMLARGETEGTFQLNGSGMTRFLKELKPTTIHDINAMVALFRPGPMETIPDYIRRKHDPSLVTYLDPRMKEYLDSSYGLLVYQDDVLLTAIKIAGYSWLEADTLRKAMGKKIPAEMEAQREKFISGAVKNGLGRLRAEQLWKLIEPFAAYGFNKAHAASYGKVAYQTAYMKANYPLEYMAAVLTAEAGDTETIAAMVGECKRMGITVLPPDVNESFGDFTVLLGASARAPFHGSGRSGDTSLAHAQGLSSSQQGAIRFGLHSIKNFGNSVANSIIAERKKNGRFKSLSDFLRRVSAKSESASGGKDHDLLNKKGLESLIKCGALDSLGERGTMLAHLELLLQYHREAMREGGHDSLFAELSGGMQDLRLPKMQEAPLEQKLAWEKELLGLYVSGHPLDRFKEKLVRRSMTIKELREKLSPGMETVAAGIIEDVRTVLTRSGDQMAFIKLADLDGSIEAVFFPKSFAAHRELLKPESCVALKGRLSNRNGQISLVAEQLKAL